jgi:hypothetical protein
MIAIYPFLIVNGCIGQTPFQPVESTASTGQRQGSYPPLPQSKYKIVG